MATINEEIYKYVSSDTTMQSTFNGIFYLINDNRVDNDFATIYLIDDPKVHVDICGVIDQGQARFQCDAFTLTAIDGLNYRQVFIDTMQDLQSTIYGGWNIWNIEVVNSADRANTINGLFQFSFECVVHYKK